MSQEEKSEFYPIRLILSAGDGNVDGQKHHRFDPAGTLMIVFEYPDGRAGCLFKSAYKDRANGMVDGSVGFSLGINFTDGDSVVVRTTVIEKGIFSTKSTTCDTVFINRNWQGLDCLMTKE